MDRFRSAFIATVALTALAGLSACGASSSPSDAGAATGVAVRVDPASATLSPASGLTFAAAVTGTVDTSVRWSVVEPGGGTIDTSGNYVAPGTVGTFHVVAQSVADPSLTATVTVTVTTGTPPSQPPAPSGSCDGEPMRTTGTTYYVCDCASGSQPGCVAGNDSNTGTSPSTPWRSWSKAITQFNTMAAGDTVAFCRGGAWSGLTSVIPEMRNQNCRADSTTRPPRAGDVSTCDMRDYTPSWGGTNRPVLAFAPNQYFMRMGWYEDNNGGWDASKVTGVRVLNLDLVAANDGTARAFSIWGRVHHLEVCGNTFRDGWGNAYGGTTTMTIRYVNFHHNRITNNPFGIGQIVGTSCAQDCWFDSNYMDLNGGGVNRDHSIYGGGSPYGGSNWPTALVGPNPGICMGTGSGTICYAISRGTRITNNEIRRSAWGAGGTGCAASALVVHGPHEDLLIENNLIYEPPGTAKMGCYGIDQTAGIDMPGAWTRTVIRRNQVYNVNGNGITIGNCKDCVIEDNLIVGGSQGIQYPDPGNRCTSVAYPPTASYTCSGNLPDSGGIVRNNTVYDAGAISINNVGGQGSGWVAANNAVCGPGAGVSSGTGTATGNNLVSASCPGWFENPGTDPATASFKPGAPLTGTGGTLSEGSSYISVAPWSATDPGLAPSGAPNIGALR